MSDMVSIEEYNRIVQENEELKRKDARKNRLLKENGIEEVTPFPFQEEEVKVMEEASKRNDVIFQLSGTGSGKTVMISELARKLDRQLVVIAPNEGICDYWMKIAKGTATKILHSVSYSCIVRRNSRAKSFVKRLETIEQPIGHPSFFDKRIGLWISYQWSLPEDVLIVFDEAHLCSGISRQSAAMMGSIRIEGAKIVLASATLIPSVKKFRNFGIMAGIFTSGTFEDWMKANPDPKEIHKLLIPKYGSCVQSTIEARLLLKSNKMFVTNVSVDKTHGDQEIFRDLHRLMYDKSRVRKKNRQQDLIEYSDAVVPIIAELTRRALVGEDEPDGVPKSVVIFVNYSSTIRKLSKKFEEMGIKHSRIAGEKRGFEKRSEAIDKFQSDEHRVCIVSIAAGSSGISLHDIHGKYPRISYVLPTDNLSHVVQAFGRIFREGVKSSATQRLLNIVGTPYGAIVDRLAKKIGESLLLNAGTKRTFVVRGLTEGKGTILLPVQLAKRARIVEVDFDT